METAAALALLGLPAWLFLTTRDPEERIILTAVARRAQEMLDVQQQNLAVHIVNNYVKARRRG